MNAFGKALLAAVAVEATCSPEQLVFDVVCKTVMVGVPLIAAVLISPPAPLAHTHAWKLLRVLPRVFFMRVALLVCLLWRCKVLFFAVEFLIEEMRA